MIVQICPEGKEIILEDILHGNNKYCKACRTRHDRSDLVQLDSEKPYETNSILKGLSPTRPSAENALPNHLLKNAPGFEDINLFEDNTKDYENFVGLTPEQLVLQTHYKDSFNEALALSLKTSTVIPTIHSLDELILIKQPHWVNDVDSEIYNYRKLVVKTPCSTWLFFFSFTMLGMAIFFTKVSMDEGKVSSIFDLSGTLLVIPCALYLLFFIPFVIAFWRSTSKTWFKISPDRIEVRRGLFAKGTFKSYKRDSNVTRTDIKFKGSTREGTPYYNIYITDGFNPYKLGAYLDQDFVN